MRKTSAKGLSSAIPMALILFFLAVLLSPSINRRVSPDIHNRLHCANNLRQITLAILNYESQYGHLPPTCTSDADGNKLHSWRTLILPFMEEKNLCNQIDFSRPWNDPVNAVLTTTIPDVYQCPAENGNDRCTSYLAVVGDKTAWQMASDKSLAELVEADCSTEHAGSWLLIIECTKSTRCWAEPADIKLTELKAVDVQTAHGNECHASFTDGHVEAFNIGKLAEIRLRAEVTSTVGHN